MSNTDRVWPGPPPSSANPPRATTGPLATTEPVAASVTPPVRVFLDAGHGAPGNSGNEDAACWDDGVAVPVDGRSCVQNPAEPGFAVLWSDEGPLAEERHDLARRVAAAMIAQGFLAYDGVDYGGLYAIDPDAPGVFVDRHRPERRIRLLRRPAMPSILIETHHAWHPDEAAAWQQAATRDRLVAALAAALGPGDAPAE